MMRIINLTQTQYRNYARLNSHQNFGQTVEYASLEQNIDKKKLFLGLIDDNMSVLAATLILVINKAPGIKEAIAPNGYLIDYANYELVRTFTEELKKYLNIEKVTYLITNPMFKVRTYNKSRHIIENNERILNNLYNLGYQNIGYNDDFEKYDVIIDNNNGLYDIYNNFNRNTKRNITAALNLGITLHKAKPSEMDQAYELFKKKTTNSLYYYKNLMNIYKNDDNLMELFIAKLNPHNFLINSKKLYEKEKIKNERLHDKFNKYANKSSEKLINKKINSDKTLEKYRENLNRAIEVNQLYKEDIIVGTSIVIKNNHEIYFLIDGFLDDYRFIHSSHILKWAIIKKYSHMGYKIFNLGEIHKEYYNKQSKYYKQYLFKIGFGGNVVEYPPNLLLVINSFAFNTYQKLKKWKF